MATFAVIAPEGSAKLDSAMEDNFQGKFFQFAPGQYMLATEGMTTADVANKIGAEGEVGRVVVFLVSGHWGYHRKDLWEWFTVNA